MQRHLDVRIPYQLNKQLGQAYNRIFETVDDWVLIIDHDILLMNPNWCQMCLDTIGAVGHKAGWITCRSNTGRKEQKVGCNNEQHHDMKYQLNICRDRYQQNKGAINDVTETCEKFAGNFILTHKKAWEDAKGFKDGFLGIDFDYYYRLRRAGYRFYVMEDLYVYHHYKRHWQSGGFNV